jgi:hypothetical protein
MIGATATELSIAAIAISGTALAWSIGWTLRVYAQATKRRDRLTGRHLKAYDRALEWTSVGDLVLPQVTVAACPGEEVRP